MNHRPLISPVELALVALLILMIILGPVAHGWFEWRLNRDVARTQAEIEQRMVAVEGFVESRKGVAPSDVLAWLQKHSLPCPQNCEPCPTIGVPPASDEPIDNGS